ncbi:aldose 1-epimerase family protein [Stratiformator vulcanicus]|uniref:DUF4432 domain-containing protein n=1 Tax=Stratiformator vulcanicus TaxID=2527980 RepID=A0A517R289_9PLAN|nr:aldose 1-epimerase family protein [Stratiformator vulcanicus]QDT38005.1 hypothetical protein Pan189_23890 [Stratiformator vulcanicus]
MSRRVISLHELTEPVHWEVGNSLSSISRTTLTGGVSEGVELVTLKNPSIEISVIPTRGMGLLGGAALGYPLGWQSPVQRPVHPSFVDLSASNGLGWLTGFNEFLCRCGIGWNGPPGDDDEGSPVENPLTLHGRIANIPADNVSLFIDESDGSVGITGQVRECGLFGTNLTLEVEYRLPAEEPRFHVRDVITNDASRPAEVELLYHINVGPPFLEDGSVIAVSADAVAPRDPRAAEGIEDWSKCGPPESGFAEQAYYFNTSRLPTGHAAMVLANRNRDLAVEVAFDPDVLPHGAVWKNTAAVEDGYVIGLEPATDFPNHRSFERAEGRLKSIAPGEQLVTELSVSVLASTDTIQNTIAAAESLEPVIHRSAGNGFSPS